MPSELSVPEIIRKFYDSPKSQSNSQPVRLVPASVVAEAENYFAKTEDVEKTWKYVLAAFHIYRESVCHGIFAVHYPNNGAFEWPTPKKFSWNNMDAVLIGGEAVHTPIDDGKVHVTANDDEFARGMIYVVEDPGRALLLDQNRWQNASLSAYAHPISRDLEALLKGKISQDEAKAHLEKELVFLRSGFAPMDF
jgi:hypothetical protein